MPTQKDFKRLVRTRMAKTGEAYTAARAQLLKRRSADLPGAALAREAPAKTADIVTYQHDPRQDPDQLARPAAVVAGGVRLR